MALKAKPIRTNIIVSDPIADLLTRVRNAIERNQYEIGLPTSKMKEEVVRILQQEGYIDSYQVQGEIPRRILTVKLKYKGKRNREQVIHGLERVSKPGCRVYVPVDEIPFVMGGLGISILSTPQGVMTGQQAKRLGTGGEVICNVW